MISASDQHSDLRAVLRMLWLRKWPVLLCVVSVPALTYAVTSRIKKTYQSSAIVQVQGAAVDTTLFTPTPSISQPEAIAATAKLAQTSQVGAPAARLLGLPGSVVPTLLGKVAVSEDDATGFVTIEVTDPNAAQSAAIANAFARAVVALRSSQAQGQVNRTVGAVAQRLAELPAAETTARAQLSDQLQRLRAVAAAQISNAQIIKYASAATSPASPKPVRDTTLALVLGLLLGAGLAVLLDRLDRSMRTIEDLQEVADLPLLAAIPGTAFAGNALFAGRGEAFQTLRASLTYFNVDRPLESIMITSADPGEGKTTVAVNLAISFARSGRDVILLDTDLRRSSLLPMLETDGLALGGGLGEVLVTGLPLVAAVIDIPTPAGRLRVLHAGLPPPNPSELLSSERMAAVLREAADAAEIVIVDSSPLLAVSDSVPLLRQVSGIVVLARLKRTTRESMRRFREIVRLAGGNVLGVVATGAPEPDQYGYGYGSKHEQPVSPATARVVDLGESVTPTRRIAAADVDATRGEH